MSNCWWLVTAEINRLTLCMVVGCANCNFGIYIIFWVLANMLSLNPRAAITLYLIIGICPINVSQVSDVAPWPLLVIFSFYTSTIICFLQKSHEFASLLLLFKLHIKCIVVSKTDYVYVLFWEFFVTKNVYNYYMCPGWSQEINWSN